VHALTAGFHAFLTVLTWGEVEILIVCVYVCVCYLSSECCESFKSQSKVQTGRGHT